RALAAGARDREAGPQARSAGRGPAGAGAQAGSRRGEEGPQALEEGLDLDPTLEVLGHVAGDRDALAAILAGDLAAARRDLPGREPGLAEPLRPVGNQRAVGRAGDRVLGHAHQRGEEA